ncbi:MAG: response regulator transcription factor [Candidatus Anammoxibacter sp.]
MKKKVLIIEDDPCIRMLLLEVIEEAFEDSLDNEKLEILEAYDGEQGFQMALKERPDLIFSDVMMPKMDGFEVCRKIKNDPDLKDTYFILLTAKGQEVDKTKGATAGCDEYMTKPFKPELIVSKVEERLSLQKND